MRLPHWMEETQRRSRERITPEQARTIEQTWQRASRRGMLGFILVRGVVLAVWSSVCLVFFGWRGHSLHVMRQPFYLATVISCLVVFSAALPTMLYLFIRSNARKLHAVQAAGSLGPSAG